MSILGIIGKKRSGKDTVANQLVEQYGYTRYGFADPIKKAVCIAFGWDQEEMEKPENKEMIDPLYGISYRQALQDFGTDWGQLGLSERYSEFKKITGRTLWVKRFLQEVENNPDKNWVISDVRFHHEVDTILHTELYGHEKVFIKVERPEYNNIIDMHYSEKDIDNLPYNILISNNSTLEALASAVNQVMETIPCGI